jgi:serine/threonine protein kinase
MSPKSDPLDPHYQLNSVVEQIQLLSILGQGSFAVVFLGRHVITGELFAVKCLYKTGLSIGQVNLLKEEVKIHALVNDIPNVIKLLNCIETEHHLYLILEYCDFDLLTYLQSTDNQRVSPNEAKMLFIEIAGAVKELHARGVYHRDLKPENILMKNNHCYISDFGLATRDSLSLEFGCGSFRYMSPECFGEMNLESDCDEHNISEHNLFHFADSPITESGLLSPIDVDNFNAFNISEKYIDASISNSKRLQMQADTLISSILQSRPRNSSNLLLPYLSASNDVWSLGVLLINLFAGKNPWNKPDVKDKFFRLHFFKETCEDSFVSKFGVSNEFARLIRRIFHFDPSARLSCEQLIQQVNSIKSFFQSTLDFGLLTPSEEFDMHFFPEKFTPGVKIQLESSPTPTDMAETMFEMEL